MSSLTSEDLEWLDTHYPGAWELVPEVGNAYLIIRNFDIPAGYRWSSLPEGLPDQQNTREFMLVIPANYPTTPLDMFYLYPGIQKTNNQPINALVSETHLNKKWQRWSRHYPWKAGIDNVETHINNMKDVLARESQS